MRKTTPGDSYLAFFFFHHPGGIYGNPDDKGHVFLVLLYLSRGVVLHGWLIARGVIAVRWVRFCACGAHPRAAEEGDGTEGDTAIRGN